MAFSPEVVDERLDRFEKEFKWRPIPHEISEVDQWTARLSNAFEVDQKGNIYQTRDLTKKEARRPGSGRRAALCRQVG